jgi:predicted DNA-binding protein with PD1-like motif
MPTGGFSVEPARKKRGRPRKYSPDGNNNNIALGLATSPVTPTVDSSGGAVAHSSEPSSSKKGRGRPPSSGKKQLDALGEPGVGFTPHVIICKSGEDIASIIRSFSQQGPRSVCILSANGAVSKLTLRQPAMSAGAVTYEGKFEIISLTGNFSAADRSGNLSVSLAGSDGRVLGGSVAGVLMAATPVQVIVGSFAPSTKKKQASNDGGAISSTQPAPNMMNFGGAVAGSSPRSDGEASSESSDESDNSPFNRGPPETNNNNQGQGQGMQQNMYNMGWPNNNTMNMLPN